jgi:hypothetical protein
MNINIVLNALIHILILILLFTFFINNRNDTNSVIFILAVTIVFVCYLLEFVRRPDIMNIKLNNSKSKNNSNSNSNSKNSLENIHNNINILKKKVDILNNIKNNSKNNNKNTSKNNNKNTNNIDGNIIENFTASINHTIGPWDGINVEEKAKNKRFKIEDKYPDEDCKWRKKPCNVDLYKTVGSVSPTGLEIEHKPDTSHTKTLPTVTGNKEDPNSLFMFAFNQSHPDCCPSTFSTSTGCVCTTKEQREHINKRGGNRSKDIYPAI